MSVFFFFLSTVSVYMYVPHLFFSSVLVLLVLPSGIILLPYIGKFCMLQLFFSVIPVQEVDMFHILHVLDCVLEQNLCLRVSMFLPLVLLILQIQCLIIVQNRQKRKKTISWNCSFGLCDEKKKQTNLSSFSIIIIYV